MMSPPTIARISLVGGFLLGSAGFAVSWASSADTLKHAMRKPKNVAVLVFIYLLPFDKYTLNASGRSKWIAIQDEEVGFLANLE